MLKKWDTNRKITALVYGAIFLIIFLCNFLTPYLVDDFNYRLSFATKEPLERVWEIIPSMAAHAQSMNGRLTAHSLVQLFMLMPRIVFDLVNSGMFCLLIWLITGYASKERSNLLAIAAFCAIWLYEPAFGEVNLWQDGAINYMWSTVVMLIYLKPFVRLYLDGNSGLDNAAAKLGFLIFSALAGSYSETSSAAAVFIAFLLVVMSAWDAGWKINWYAAISVAAAAVGYLTIYMAPAQWVNKSTELSFKTLLNHFETATQMYTTFGIMAAAAVVFLVVNLSELAEKKDDPLGDGICGRIAGSKLYYDFCRLLSRPVCGRCLCSAADGIGDLGITDIEGWFVANSSCERNGGNDAGNISCTGLGCERCGNYVFAYYRE